MADATYNSRMRAANSHERETALAIEHIEHRCPTLERDSGSR
jgi:hypothetical protein